MEVNIGYAWGQLARAQETAETHADADVRARARETVAKWKQVIAGMQAGTVDVGSRTPTSAPPWVTLEVVTGGFATGSYSAGGPLRDHERSLAERLGIPATRMALNLHFLMSSEASELLVSGRYRIDVPEEGALLVVAWLRRRGELARADALVGEISPWFEALRFYPVPADRPVEMTEAVRLQDASVTLREIDVDRRQRRFETMRAAIEQWKPLRARALALFAETIVDEMPGRVFPDGWHARVAAIVEERARAGSAHTARAKEASKLVEALERCARDPQALPPHEAISIWNTITRYVRAHGAPGTPAHDEKIAAERAAVAAPLHADLRRVLIERVRAAVPLGGVDFTAALAPVNADEAGRSRVPAGTEIPEYFARKVARSADGTLPDLIERGVIVSSEQLARVLPQVTSQVRANALDDEDARRLYVASYTAFRRRRGLLLVDYQHQIRVGELPWVAALEAARADTAHAKGRAREAVGAASAVALRAFPYTIVPNKLVTELYSLTNAAGLALPLVEELAADIFMGAFTAKFVEAAQVSARLLAGTLYVRYYAIDTAEIARIPVVQGQPSAAFAEICRRRAAPLDGDGSYVAQNGKVIEQAQILTTHNLGVLFDALPLRAELAPHLGDIAKTCFAWVMRRLRLRTWSWHEMLINLKNSAYAWRQLVFYLSLEPDVPAFLAWAREQVASADAPFRQRFEPALRGLELAAQGLRSDVPAFSAGGGRVFTGWSTDRHWLAPARDEPVVG